VGYGERFPIVENRTPEGQDDPVARAQNRRVEVVILR
jgi:outer membrane protein OmpA-like peptidoglycan-associated protein